ncbi:type 1 glutamine amidotransferase-like domain-containing protein [Candidatus Roizmanbacteria bacterium]|nr:type 1 glutamine amidotransferase-like domain-containing protein [Candidatus Roizmanbacteria bacterium]
MKQLLLTSAGLSTLTIKQQLLSWISKKSKECKVAFIPTAADPEEDKWFVGASRQELVECGFQVTDVDLKQDYKWIKSQLELADVIYINGGNTFYLLKWIRKSGVDRYLNNLIENGTIYVGTSAGSLLVGPNIELAAWKKDWDVNNYIPDSEGLKIVPFEVFPHYEEQYHDLLEQGRKKVNYEIIPLTDKQGVVVEGKKYKII